MAIGAQFSSLISDVRAETRRSTRVNVGTDDLDTIKRRINSAYLTQLASFDWPHLRVVQSKIQLNAGQRVYDIPAGFDVNSIRNTVVWLGSLNQPIHRGINVDHYSFLDPANNQRSDPPLAWDFKFDTTSKQTQIEIWPIPASSSYTFQFEGRYQPTKLINDSDICYLDDELVIGFAAGALLMSQESEDAEIRMRMAEQYALDLKNRVKSDDSPVQLGLGPHRIERYQHPNIVIKPTGAV